MSYIIILRLAELPGTARPHVRRVLPGRGRDLRRDTSGGATSEGSTVTLDVTHLTVCALVSTQIEHHTTEVTKSLTLTVKPRGKK